MNMILSIDTKHSNKQLKQAGVMTRFAAGLLALLCLTIGFLWTNEVSAAAIQSSTEISTLFEGQKPVIGDYASDFTLKSHLGENVRLHELRGNVVLLHFWSSWSATSVRYLKQLDEFYQKQDNSNLSILSVNLDPKKSERIVEKHDIKHFVLYDEGKQITRRYQIDTIPTFVLLDRSGKIILELKGIDPRYIDIVKHKLKVLLKEQEL